jgi:HTH-type transcriptional regulator/antitoxin MqsA
MTPALACPFCRAHTVQPVREPVEIALGQRHATVVAERMRCSSCAQVFSTTAQMDEAQRAAADRIRADEGLLTGTEIRTIRESLALTQHDFEQLLGIGPKTVVRWERGTVFQNRATDLLVRLVASSIDTSTLLATWNGVSALAHPQRTAASPHTVPVTETASPARPASFASLDERYDVSAADAARRQNSRRARRKDDVRVLPIGPHLKKHEDAFETHILLDSTASPTVDAAAEQILDAYSV